MNGKGIVKSGSKSNIPTGYKNRNLPNGNRSTGYGPNENYQSGNWRNGLRQHGLQVWEFHIAAEFPWHRPQLEDIVWFAQVATWDLDGTARLHLIGENGLH
jgi:hypothetical protein